MIARLWTAALATVVALLGGIAVALAATMVAPEGAGFAVTFPAPPERKSVDIKVAGDPVTGAVWSAGADGVNYFVDYVDYAHDIAAANELAANAKNFAASFRGRVTSRQRLNFKRSGETLPGLRFTFEGPTTTGAGVAVVAGRRSYVAAAVSVKPHRDDGEVDRFLKSFRLTALQP